MARIVILLFAPVVLVAHRSADRIIYYSAAARVQCWRTFAGKAAHCIYNTYPNTNQYATISRMNHIGKLRTIISLINLLIELAPFSVHVPHAFREYNPMLTPYTVQIHHYHMSQISSSKLHSLSLLALQDYISTFPLSY